MAGIFGFFDYNKPGKGIDPDAPPKAPFFLFFELIWRKMSRFVVFNLFLFAIIFPIITMLFMGYYSYAGEFLPESELVAPTEQAVEGEEQLELPFSMLPSLLFSVYFMIPRGVFYVLLGISIICYGPAMCGLTYCLRNYVDQEHAWFSDFFVRMKRNFLQGSIHGILEIAVFMLLTFNITAVPDEGASSGDATMMLVTRSMSIAVMVVLFFLRHYVYLIIVTFDLKLHKIWKNSFIFGMLNLWRNILVSLIIAALIVVMLIVPYADIVLLPFLFLSVTGFLTLFVCKPIVYKYMVKKEGEDEDENGNEIAETDTLALADGGKAESADAESDDGGGED